MATTHENARAELEPERGTVNVHSPSVEDEPVQIHRRERIRGLILGVLTGWALLEIGTGIFIGGASGYLPLLTGVLGCLLIRGRAGHLMWGVSACAALLF